MSYSSKLTPEHSNALYFISLGIKYLNLVYNALEQNIKQNNSHIIISDGEFSWDRYFEKTKWSDFNIIEPVLFCFYHGLELNIKGLLFLQGHNNVNSTHKLRILYDDLAEIKEIPKNILEVMEKYILNYSELFFSRFLVENKKDIDCIYESLRYPTDTKFKNSNNYFELHYKGENSVKEYGEMLEDILKLKNSIIKFYREQNKFNN